jgi:undecaprenyl-phosphate 4-deoxy-4-formamido-L-arabinose transferase
MSQRHDEPGATVSSISVVIPVYNAAGSLQALLERLEQCLRATGLRFEAILVNDGSRDDSWSVIQKEAVSRPWLLGIDLSRNFGQHNALLCGIRAARHDVIVTMDDDLQNPPEEIPRLLELLATGRDVVYGFPEQGQHGLWRDMASQTTKIVLGGVLGATTARQVSGFRAFRTELRSAFGDFGGPSVNIDVLLTWATTKFGAVTVKHQPRQVGASNYTFVKLIAHAMNMLTGFSTVPLQIATVLGFALTLCGCFLLIVVIVRYILQGVMTPGFTFLASVIVIFSGAQLFTLGVIGEYLARMHFRIMRQPSYAIRREVGAPRGQQT